MCISGVKLREVNKQTQEVQGAMGKSQQSGWERQVSAQNRHRQREAMWDSGTTIVPVG
jgi:hypothetical protein